MPYIPFNTFLECRPGFPAVIRIILSHCRCSTHEDGKEKKQNCDNKIGKHRRNDSHFYETIEESHRDCQITDIEKHHSDKVVPAIEKCFFNEESFHIPECKQTSISLQLSPVRNNIVSYGFLVLSVFTNIIFHVIC